MKEINAEIKKKFSDKTQFVILVYSDTENDFNNENEQVKDLENDGIKIIRLSDILGFDINTLEYQIDYDIDHHPNAKAWDAVVPALAKELKLQRL